MFICDECVKGCRCYYAGTCRYYGACEICHVTKQTWDCSCSKGKQSKAPFTLEGVQETLLEHTRQLARLSFINPRDISIAAQLACAKEMCQLAGLSNAAIQDALLDAQMN